MVLINPNQNNNMKVVIETSYLVYTLINEKQRYKSFTESYIVKFMDSFYNGYDRFLVVGQVGEL